MNIGTLLPRHARYRAHHLAVVFEEQRLTYRAFNQRVNRLANALFSIGINKGDKVATAQLLGTLANLLGGGQNGRGGGAAQSLVARERLDQVAQ